MAYRMTGSRQTMTIHAPSAEALEAVMEFLADALQDYKDSGSAPEQIFYDLGEVEPSEEDFE
jgi:hypothetical protein